MTQDNFRYNFKESFKVSMATRNQNLQEEAQAGLGSMIQQGGTVFLGFILMLLLTGGAPSGFAIALSFGLGTTFVAWSEQKRIKALQEPNTVERRKTG
jgi:hypothetical protein